MSAELTYMSIPVKTELGLLCLRDIPQLLHVQSPEPRARRHLSSLSRMPHRVAVLIIGVGTPVVCPSRLSSCFPGVLSLLSGTW